MGTSLKRAVSATGLALLVLSSPAWAQGTAAVDRTNQDIQELWTRDGRPMVGDAIDKSLNRLAGTTQGSGNLTVDIVGSPRYTLQADVAPGFTQLDDQGVAARLPLSGAWRIQVEFDLDIRYRKGFVRFSKQVQIRGEISDLVSQLQIDLDTSDPDLPTIKRVHPPQVAFDVRLRTDKWYLNAILYFFRGKLRSVARDAVDGAIANLAPTLAQLAAQPQLFGLGAAPVATAAAGPLTLEGAAKKIQESILRDHLPYGSLMELNYDQAYSGTWEDSLNDPNFTPGNVVGIDGYGDSAIWTGHYLASNAFRYAITADPAALRDASATVAAIGSLLRVRGVPGLLNRALAPISAIPGFVGNPEHYALPFQGEDYACFENISRDQYVGVLFGLGATYDLIPDPALRDAVRENVELAVDYMLANGWTARRSDGTHSTTWTLSATQQLTWLHLAERVAPGKYSAELADYASLADVVWLGPWVSTTDTHNSYYKFNLSHGALYTLLRLEMDPGRWWKEARGLRILRKAVGHHQNAHFDVIYAAHDPTLQAGLKDEVTDLLTWWLKRPRRYQGHDLNNDPTIEKVSFTPSIGSAVTGGSSAAVMVAKQPLPLVLRETTDYVWQRSPFGLISHGDGKRQAPGVDFTLSYWMARYHNVLR